MFLLSIPACLQAQLNDSFSYQTFIPTHLLPLFGEGKSRLTAAYAAIAVDAEIYVFNDYFPQLQGQAFQAVLRAG